jgi:thioredoxin
MENLTVESFKEKVFDYTNGDEWSFKGTKPTILKFEAEWCQPCKVLAPILEEVAAEHPEIDVYKIDTDAESELAMTFGIRNVPSMLFIPIGAEPQLAVGVLPKEQIKKAIAEIFVANNE